MIDITFVNNLSLLFQLLGFIWYLKRWEEVTRFNLLSTIFCAYWDYPNEDELSKITRIMMPQGTCWILNNFVKFVLNSSEQFVVHNNTCYNAIVGPLLKYIEKKKVFTEKEASLVVKDIVSALDFLHKKGTVCSTKLSPFLLNWKMFCLVSIQLIWLYSAVICFIHVASSGHSVSWGSIIGGCMLLKSLCFVYSKPQTMFVFSYNQNPPAPPSRMKIIITDL